MRVRSPSARPCERAWVIVQALVRPGEKKESAAGSSSAKSGAPSGGRDARLIRFGEVAQWQCAVRRGSTPPAMRRGRRLAGLRRPTFPLTTATANGAAMQVRVLPSPPDFGHGTSPPRREVRLLPRAPILHRARRIPGLQGTRVPRPARVAQRKRACGVPCPFTRFRTAPRRRQAPAARPRPAADAGKHIGLTNRQHRLPVVQGRPGIHLCQARNTRLDVWGALYGATHGPADVDNDSRPLPPGAR